MIRCMGNGKKTQILLSTYNGEKYLREQLDSYLMLEGFENVKVLIRDDGSTDSTPDILDEYHQKYGFTIVKGFNLGVNGSIYELLSLCDKSCEYFALSDQDDVWLPAKLTIALERLGQLDSNIPLLFASCSQVVTEDLSPLGSTLIPQKVISFYNAAVQNVAPGHTQVFNRTLMEHLVNNYSKETIVIDWWIYLIASVMGQVVFEKQFTVLHRQHGNNAVGYELNKLKSFQNRLKRLHNNRSYAISLQLQAFYNCYKLEMRKEFTEEIERYFINQRDLISRLKYVMKCKFYRQTYLETIIFKILYILGKYNIR